jgi:hypothetical protein
MYNIAQQIARIFLFEYATPLLTWKFWIQSLFKVKDFGSDKSEDFLTVLSH